MVVAAGTPLPLAAEVTVAQVLTNTGAAAAAAAAGISLKPVQQEASRTEQAEQAAAAALGRLARRMPAPQRGTAE